MNYLLWKSNNDREAKKLIKKIKSLDSMYVIVPEFYPSTNQLHFLVFLDLYGYKATAHTTDNPVGFDVQFFIDIDENDRPTEAGFRTFHEVTGSMPFKDLPQNVIDFFNPEKVQELKEAGIAFDQAITDGLEQREREHSEQHRAAMAALAEGKALIAKYEKKEPGD